MKAGRVLTDSAIARSQPRATRLARRAREGMWRLSCGLRGHLYVLHSEPGRLSLRCFACGAQTRGWIVDVRPAFRNAGRSRASGAVSGRPLEPATDLPRRLRRGA